jgi:hypothetical protein
MEVVGAVIFFGGLLSLAGLVIYSGLKERKPDLILPLNGDELRIFKPGNGWVHIYRVNKGKVGGAWEADTGPPEFVKILHEAGVTTEEASDLATQIRQIPPRQRRLSAAFGALAVSAVVLLLLAWGAGMADRPVAAWLLLILGASAFVVLVRVHIKESRD